MFDVELPGLEGAKAGKGIVTRMDEVQWDDSTAML